MSDPANNDDEWDLPDIPEIDFTEDEEGESLYDEMPEIPF